MKSLSLCMIVKDEEKYLENCLKSVESVIDEIIIVDTGSSDSTLQIASKYNAKIFIYEWDSNFSNARNYALSKASCDWILMLDADEAVHHDDAGNLKEKIQTTEAEAMTITFCNFTGNSPNGNFVTHIGIRIFKNRTFYYNGIIHEQLNRVDQSAAVNFEDSGIRVLHYGYLKPNTMTKNKRKRNIPLIQKILDETPDCGFHLFNMGNEYMCMENYEKAVYYFNKACEQKEYRQAYYPHLLYRKASCLHCMKKNNESLRTISEGLLLYPECTDYEFLRGNIYKTTKRYTLAIESFKRCLVMGEPNRNLSFIPEAGTIRPLLSLGEVYFSLEDWDKSLEYYLRAAQLNRSRNDIIYRIAQIYNKMYKDKDVVCKLLDGMFTGDSNVNNVVLMTDILLNEAIYDKAQECLGRINKSGETTGDVTYMQGRIYFYRHDYKGAYSEFIKIVRNKPEQYILLNVWAKSLVYAVICCIAGGIDRAEINAIIDKLPESDDKHILLYFIRGAKREFNAAAAKKINIVLTEILKLSEYDLFEKMLPVMNLIDSKEVLIDLADIYYQSGYREMAVKTILRSVKEFGVISSKAVYILNKEFSL